jgi:hypothetical protein
MMMCSGGLRVGGRSSLYDLFYGSDVVYAVDTKDATYVCTVQLPRNGICQFRPTA